MSHRKPEILANSEERREATARAHPNRVCSQDTSNEKRSSDVI